MRSPAPKSEKVPQRGPLFPRADCPAARGQPGDLHLLRNRENHPQRGGFIPALPAVRPRHGGVFPVTHPTAKEGLPHLRQPFSVYGRSLFMGGNRPQRRGRWPLSAGFLFSRCAAFKTVGRCPFSPNGSVKRWTVPAGHQRPCKLFVKRLLRPSGTLPNSRPSRQTRRAKTLRSVPVYYLISPA